MTREDILRHVHAVEALSFYNSSAGYAGLNLVTYCVADDYFAAIRQFRGLDIPNPIILQINLHWILCEIWYD